MGIKEEKEEKKSKGDRNEGLQVHWCVEMSLCIYLNHSTNNTGGMRSRAQQPNSKCAHQGGRQGF